MNTNTNQIIYNRLQAILNSHPNIELLINNNSIKNLNNIALSLNEIISILGYNLIRYKFNFNIHTDERLINEVGYPWDIPLNKVINGYIKGNLTDIDIIRFFDLLEKLLPKIHKNIEAILDTYVATDKWKFYLNKRLEMFKDILNSYSSKYFIVKFDITESNADYAFYDIRFYFNEQLSCSRKNTIEKLFMNKLIPLYNKVSTDRITSMSDFFNFAKIGFGFHYLSNKTTPSNIFFMRINVNNWTSLAMDPIEQFIPKLGHNKIS